MKSAHAPNSLTRLPVSAPVWFSRLWLSQLLRHLPETRYGTLNLALPDGQLLAFGHPHEGEPRAEIRLHNYRPLRRLLQGGQLGMAESYMDGDWDSPDLVALVDWTLGNEAQLPGLMRGGNWWLRQFNRLLHRRRANTRRGSRRNIAYHYDLGNDFYRLWLDPSMTYSSALFAHPDQSLEQAQQHKYRHIANQLKLQPGQEVLEIGCGWGGFAELAAREYGVKVTGITLSQEQLSYAQTRIEKAGLTSQCTFSLTDYRDLNQRFDHIVSIEMFEAVGEENWPVYFDTLNACLKPGGNALLQVISIDDARFEDYRRTPEFIQRYIFPGGMLPSPGRLREAALNQGLKLLDEHRFGQDYAHTLALWRHSFLEQWPRIHAQGYDERFRRMWLFYLAYCEGGFRRQSIDVGFYLLGRN